MLTVMNALLRCSLALALVLVLGFAREAYACSCGHEVQDPCVIADELRNNTLEGLIARAEVVARVDSFIVDWEVTLPTMVIDVQETLVGQPPASTRHTLLLDPGYLCYEYSDAEVGDQVVWIATGPDTAAYTGPTFCTDYLSVRRLTQDSTFEFELNWRERRTVTLDELRGRVDCDFLIDVDDVPSAGDFALRAVRVGDELHFEYSGGHASPDGLRYQLYDVTGRSIFSGRSPQQPVGALPRGVYVAVLRDARDRVLARRMVKL